MIKIAKKYLAQFTLISELKTRKLNLSRSFSDPDDAIWFFGCSHVFGCGVGLDETAPIRLEKLLGKPVMNYGVPASGPMMVEYQLDSLLKDHEPLAVVIAWPSFSRWQSGNMLGFPLFWLPSCLEEDYIPTHTDHVGCKNVWPEKWQEYKNLVLTRQIEKDNLELSIRVRKKLKNYPLVEFQYIPDSYTIKFPTPGYPFLDIGNDGDHCGPLTQIKIAEWIKDELQLLL
jgi:hypothetical protein